MKRLMFKSIVIMLSVLIYYPLNRAHAQDIDAMLRSAWFRHSGHASAELNLQRDRLGRPEWNYSLSAQYRPVIKGVAIPLGLSYNRFSGLGTQHPFNRWYIAPQYRWVKAHIGRGSMSFSPYTLNGIEFTGLGLELNPGDHWSTAVMYGTLSQAGMMTTSDMGRSRRAWGSKLEYKQTAYRLGFSILHAWDAFEKIGSTASANLALSVKGAVQVLKHVELQAEIARSSILTQKDESAALAVWDRFFRHSPSLNDESHWAYKISLGHPYLNVSYEHVDPRYRSFGTCYEQNNFRNLSVNSQYTLKKWQLALRMGYEQNNIDGTQAESVNKWVWAAMVHGGFGEKVRLRLDYSNYQGYARVRSLSETLDPDYLPIFDDTLEYRQLNQSISANVNWEFGAQHLPQNLSIDVQFQQGRNHSYDSYLNNQLQYQITWREQHRIGISLIHSMKPEQNQSAQDIGTMLSYNSIFLDKRLRVRVSSQYQNTLRQNHSMLSFQSSGQFSITPRQQLGLQLRAWIRGRGVWQGGISVSYQITL